MEVLNSNPGLAVHDLERSAAWYRDVLGCEIRDPDPGNRTFCRSGEILKAPTDEPWGMREFGVRSPDGHRFMLGRPSPS